MRLLMWLADQTEMLQRLAEADLITPKFGSVHWHPAPSCDFECFYFGCGTPLFLTGIGCRETLRHKFLDLTQGAAVVEAGRMAPLWLCEMLRYRKPANRQPREVCCDRE